MIPRGLPRGGSLGLGMVLAKCMHEKTFSRPKNSSLIILFIIAACLAGYSYSRHAGDFWHVSGMVVFWRSSIGLAFALLLAIFVFAPATWFQTNRLYRMGYYLGEISYGIYLWHFPVILFLKQYAWEEPLAFLFVVVALTLALSALSWHLLEKPCIDFAKQRTRSAS